MAGSITWRTYTDDLGVNYSYQCAKHAADARISSQAGNVYLSRKRTGDYPLLPCDIILRYVIIHLLYINDPTAGFVSANLQRAKKKTLVVGNPIAYDELLKEDTKYVYFVSPGKTLDDAWTPKFVSGERRVLQSIYYEIPQ